MASRDRPCFSRGSRTTVSADSPNTRRMNLLIMNARILPAQGNHFPMPAARLGLELRVRIDGDRAAHELEQGQIIVRVAVERAFRELAQRAAVCGQPLLEAPD